MTLIGRGMSQHAAKIPSWEALFTLSSEQLRDAGLEPARSRRYLLWWRDRFRNGLMGIGGDLKQVTNGMAELRIVQVPGTRSQTRRPTLMAAPGMTRVIANVPFQEESTAEEGSTPSMEPPANPLAPPPTMKPDEVHRVSGVHIAKGNTIAGRGIEYVKGKIGVARLRVSDGLWEQRRGHKVDGGERRRAEVRYKRRVAEKRNAR